MVQPYQGTKAVNDETPPIELTPPEPLKAAPRVDPVSREAAQGLIQIASEKEAELDQFVADFLRTLLAEPLESEAFKRQVDAAHRLANEEIRQAAGQSSRLLEQPSLKPSRQATGEHAEISTTLLTLRRTIEDLDPSRQGDLLAPRKLLGLFPRGRRLEDYFRKYQSQQSHFDAILHSLYQGQDVLRKDNAALEEEKLEAWQLMERLAQWLYITRGIDRALSGALDELAPQDPEKARILREELLFAIRQKVQDLLTQQAVSIQGYLAMDLVRRNNLELIKGIERAATTTLSALRTAVITAQAVTHQRLVLDQVSALRDTTGQLIEGTSMLMREQAARIHQQAGQPLIDLDRLKAAFGNIYATLDQVKTFKLDALDQMQSSIDALSQEIEKSQIHLRHLSSNEGSPKQGPSGQPSLKPPLESRP